MQQPMNVYGNATSYILLEWNVNFIKASHFDGKTEHFQVDWA